MAKGLWRNGWAEFGQIGTERVFADVTVAAPGKWEWSLITSESPDDERKVAGGLRESEDAALEALEKAAQEYASGVESSAMAAAEEAECLVIEARLVKGMVQTYAADRQARAAAASDPKEV